MADTQLIARQLLSDLKRDYGLTNEQAAGVVGNLMHESAGFTTLQEANPTVPGSAGGFGFAQWTGDRRKSFDNYVEKNGLDRNSYAANYGFLQHELATDRYERTQFNKVKKAETAAEAAKIVSDNYLRPGVPHNASRIRYAEQVLPFADMPVPLGEIPNVVGSLTDTVPSRAAAPVTPSPDLAQMRRTTAPSRLVADSFAQLPQRPGSKLADSLALSPIQGGRQTAPPFDAAFDTRTGTMRLLAQPETVSSQGLGVGTSRPPAPAPAQQSPQMAGRRATDQALQTALNSRFPTRLPAIPQRIAVPQSQIDRGTPRTVATAPASKPRVTVSTPYTTPQSPIERSAARPVTQSPIGQPPATRVVQSVPMPPIPAARQAIPQSFAGMEGGAPRVAAVEERLPSTPMAGRLAAPPPVVFDPSFSTAEVTGNVGQTVRPNGPLAPIPRQTIARVPAPLPPYNAVATDLDVRAMPALPRPRPNLGMGGVDIPAVISQTGQVAPTPMPRLQRGGIFGKPQIFGHDVPLPGLLGVLQSATMAMNNASGPFNNGADNVLYNGLRGGDFNTPGAATHQAGGYLYAPKAGGGFINVGRVNPSMSAAALYDSRNAGNGGPRTAADRAGKSLSQSGGARSIMD